MRGNEAVVKSTCTVKGQKLSDIQKRETPFTVFMGILIFAKTRMKVFIDFLHDHGLSVLYDLCFN